MKRKTEMLSARIDQWMVDGIEISLEGKTGQNRTDWLKNVIAEALRKEGISQASVYRRRNAEYTEALQTAIERRN